MSHRLVDTAVPTHRHITMSHRLVDTAIPTHRHITMSHRLVDTAVPTHRHITMSHRLVHTAVPTHRHTTMSHRLVDTAVPTHRHIAMSHSWHGCTYKHITMSRRNNVSDKLQHSPRALGQHRPPTRRIKFGVQWTSTDPESGFLKRNGNFLTQKYLWWNFQEYMISSFHAKLLKDRQTRGKT